MYSTSRFSGQRILVTGGAGFIGSHLCARLRELGADVHAVSRAERAATDGGPRWWRGDVADIDTARALIDAVAPDVIFHLASHVTGRGETEQVAPTLHANLVSLVNVMTAASERGCGRIVSCGSLEQAALDGVDTVPVSPYTAAKWASGMYARFFHAHYGLPVVHLRIAMVYGPGKCTETRLVPYVIRSLLAGEAPKLSSGELELDWLYIDDAIEGLLAAGAAPDAVDGRPIELGSGRLVSVRATVEHIMSLMADRVGAGIEPDFGALPERPFERRLPADVAHARARIGWQPTTPLDDGLRATVDWYCGAGGA